MTEDKPATQAQRIETLETELADVKAKVSELDAWGDEIQAWVDNRADSDEAHARKVSELDTRYTSDAEVRANSDADFNDRLTNLDNALRILLDDRFGKNVRPAGFDDNTRIPDPDDPDHPSNKPQPADGEAETVHTEPAADNARIDALESKLDRLLDALSKRD